MKWLFFAMSIVYGYECVAVPQLGRIEVIATDATGATLKHLEVHLSQVGSKKTFDIARPVPYGTYALRVRAMGFKAIERDIYLGQPSLLVRTELPVGAECGGLNTIRGKIKSAPRDHDLWVKIVPISGTGGAESRAAASGDFLIPGIDYGHYLLIVTEGDKAVHVETLSVRGENKPIEVELQ